MSQLQQVGLSLGIIILLLLTIGVGGYYVTETKNRTEEVKAGQQAFVKDFQDVQKVENERNNITLNLMVEAEKQLLNLSKQNDDIFQQQLTNEKNIQGNLTDHRIVANETRDQILSILRNETK